MKNYLTIASLTAILSCGTTMAFAGSPDVSQVLNGVQSALNSISASGNGSDVKQSATNAGNLISRHTDLHSVSQSATGPQTARNDFGAHLWNQLIQEATNVANSLDLTRTNNHGHVTHSWDVSTVTQTATGRQSAKNAGNFRYSVDLSSGKTKQKATNAANLLSVKDINTSVTQSFSGGSQYASDSATFGFTNSDYGSVNKLSQAAANVANSINAGTIANSGANPDLKQFASAPQTALNTITFGDGHDNSATTRRLGLSLSSQDATNAANIASVSLLNGSSYQVANLTQNATNSATHTGSGNGFFAGEMDSFKQTGMNAANILTASTLSPPPSILAGINQNANGLGQSVSNSISTAGRMQNIHQVGTNAANTLTASTLGGGTSILQNAQSGFSQSVSNTISTGSYVQNTGQTATNVVNSLSLP